MVTIDNYKDIAASFLKEACNRLGIADGLIRLIYVPSLPPVQGIPQSSEYSSSEKTIFVSEKWLNSLIPQNGVTSLRSDIYAKARFAYQHIIKHTLQFDFCDAMAFSKALMGIKGILAPTSDIPFSFNALEATLQTKAVLILKNEFGLDAEVKTGTFPDGSKRTFFKLTNGEEQKLIAKDSLPQKTSIVEIAAEHKGTKDDPFDNVDDAFAYIERLEQTAYDNDLTLKEIAEADHFYDVVLHQFRYPFASPCIANYKNTFPKDCFIVNQNAPNPNGKIHFTLKPNLYRRKFLYRGQHEDYAPKPCVPNLFRNPAKSYFLDDLIWNQEMELLLMSHPLVKLLEGGVELLHDKFCIYMNLGGLAQHYYHKTRFLDFTSNSGVAKFFAVTGYDGTKDEYYSVAPDDKLGVIYCYELQYPSPFAFHKAGYHLSVIGKQVFMRSGAQHGFLLDLNKGIDLNTLPEVRAVYFRHDKAISDRIFQESNKGQEYFAMDILEKEWKAEFEQRMRNLIVSADAVRINVSRNTGETYDSICKKLADKNVRVDNSYTPCFSQDLLDEYYQDIKNGWWEEFCKDIFFYGADGILYKNALMDLPNREEYRWAFYRN